MAESIEENSRPKRRKDSRTLLAGAGISVTVVLIISITAFLLEEPLRSITEKKLNRDLKGYSVRLPKLHIRLRDLSVSLNDLVVQQAHPNPPVASFPVLKASIHWREILSGKLVAEFKLDRPKININLLQLRSETASRASLKERGWQQAVEDIYPLKINALKITDATIIYIGNDLKKPLALSHLNLRATNIRNINLPDQVYPSSFHLDTVIFGAGRGSIDGTANFLATPYPGIKGRIHLENVPVDYFNTVIPDSNFSIHGGVLKASGTAEYGPKVKIAHLENLEIHGMNFDYIHSRRTSGVEKKRAAAAGKTAVALTNKPGLFIQADQVTLTGCTIGMVNKAAHRPYRVFLADTDITMRNVSNQFSQGTGQVHLKAKFMGSGITTASANFRPEQEGSVLDLYVTIKNSQLTAMNDVLRAYGDFDVSAGIFSLVTELHIKNGAITGYIKPFFKDMKVYDRRKDSKRGFGHQMYEMMVGGVATILENRTDQEVATKVEISGRVEKPETSMVQIVVELLGNAFFKAILPRFETEKGGGGKH